LVRTLTGCHSEVAVKHVSKDSIIVSKEEIKYIYRSGHLKGYIAAFKRIHPDTAYRQDTAYCNTLIYELSF